MADISDYAMLGGGQAAALVRRDGSVDWLCWPTFQSEACFARLLGDKANGFWSLKPAPEGVQSTRRYLPDTLVLETRHECAEGVITVTDFMPFSGETLALIRIVRCERGVVPVKSRLALRFDYGRLPPWLGSREGTLTAISGSHGVRIDSDAPFRIEGPDCVADFVLSAGQEATMSLAYFKSYEAAPARPDAVGALSSTLDRWRKWLCDFTYRGRWQDAVTRSLIVLKSLAFRPTGGIVAAPTSSLPEAFGGARNWDYRFCWLRDATFTLLSLLHAGFHQEARDWRNWLLRAAAGDPANLQPVYGLDGSHRLLEWEADWLKGFMGSRPVRFGNAAAGQSQLDVYGEVVDAIFQADRHGLTVLEAEWDFLRALVEHCVLVWQEPDRGIWESRGPPQRFTHSQVMAWVALDRGVKMAEARGLDAPLERWRAIRSQMHSDICEGCFNEELGCFTQAFGSSALDAAVLLIPQVGFLPPEDPRVRSTVDVIRRRLMADGFVRRYETAHSDDGVGGDEGAFLACSLWLADALALQGDLEEAGELFERVLAVRNDLGLLSEEYLADKGLLAGNFPQALSHLCVVNTAFNLSGWGPGHDRGEQSGED